MESKASAADALAFAVSVRHLIAMNATSPIDVGLVRAAVLKGRPADSSDYDLNPDVQAALAPGRRLRPAAVLCGLVDRDDGLHVILTRRADHLRHHAGQVAFPGGRVDEADPTDAHAALREAEEEIGLRPSEVDIVGPIDGHETVTGFSVTPYVGFVDPAWSPQPEPGEVAEIFEAPLGFLLDPANRRRDYRIWQGRKRWFYAMPWQGRYIWGATARMLVGLADRVASVQEEDAAGRIDERFGS